MARSRDEYVWSPAENRIVSEAPSNDVALQRLTEAGYRRTPGAVDRQARAIKKAAEIFMPAQASTPVVSRETSTVDNPWRLTAYQAYVMDVLIEEGGQKQAAARLKRSPRSVESLIARVRWLMRVADHSHFAHVLMWDRWRRQQTAAAGGTGGITEEQA